MESKGKKSNISILNNQIRLVKNSLGTRLVFWIFMIFIGYNYVLNVLKYQGSDKISMVHPMLITLLSLEKETNIGTFFMQMLPFLVVIPGGFMLVDDMNNKTFVYYQSRISKAKYVISKAIAVFVVTFFVFEIPQLIEILLNYLAFPAEGKGSPLGLNVYEASYIMQVREYFLYKIMVKSHYLYAVLMTLKLSLFAGIMGLLAFAVSSLGIKIKVFVFLPVYLMLYILAYIGNYIYIPFCTNYYYYIYNYVAFKNLSFPIFGIFQLGILVVSVVLICIYIKRESV
jgi:hypothetical protein